jgi:hypothetical protein
MSEYEMETAGAGAMHARQRKTVAVREPPHQCFRMLAIEVKNVNAGGKASSYTD